MPGWKKRLAGRLGRVAVSAATGGMSEQALAGARLMRRKQEERVMDHAQAVLIALDDERVQQKLADLVIEIVEAAGDPPAPQPGGMERSGAQSRPLPVAPAVLSLPFRKRVEEHEGLRLDVHLVDGIPHVGIGHNCSTDSIPDEEQQLGMTISMELCRELFEDDLDDAEHKARRTCRQMGADFDSLPPAVREALHEMHFQMGSVKWSGMFARLKAGDYAAAAREALRSGLVPGKPSRWFLQTPRRCLNVCHFLSDRQLLFEVGPETAFADGSSGPTVIEHPWAG